MKFFPVGLVIGAISLITFSCEKNPGPGGAASITGVIEAYQRDGFGVVIDTFNVAKEDVYLIYGGENTMYDDDIETSYDGSFRFDYLERGSYQVFVYSKCLITDGCPNNKEPIIVPVEITGKKEIVDLGTINIFK